MGEDCASPSCLRSLQARRSAILSHEAPSSTPRLAAQGRRDRTRRGQGLTGAPLPPSRETCTAVGGHVKCIGRRACEGTAAWWGDTPEHSGSVIADCDVLGGRPVPRSHEWVGAVLHVSLKLCRESRGDARQLPARRCSVVLLLVHRKRDERTRQLCPKIDELLLELLNLCEGGNRASVSACRAHTPTGMPGVLSSSARSTQFSARLRSCSSMRSHSSIGWLRAVTSAVVRGPRPSFMHRALM